MKWLAIILKKDIVAKTVPGTRGSHQFIPVSQVTIKTKCVSEDEFYLEFNLTNEPKMCIDNLQISQFILCKYDHLYCVGMACETDIKNRDVRVKLMHPKQIIQVAYWRGLLLGSKHNNIITKTDTPSLSTVTGRQYQVSQTDLQNIEQINK